MCVFLDMKYDLQSVIIYGTHCQSILQFLGKVEKIMEEKKSI